MLVFEVLGILAEGVFDYVKESVIEAPFKAIGAIENARKKSEEPTVAVYDSVEQIFSAAKKRP